jgi:hypothetical protein
LLESSIRNIYQGRKSQGGLPVFDVNLIEDPFLLEALLYLGRTDDAKRCIGRLLNLQQMTGEHSPTQFRCRDAGTILWAATRYARLTGDKAWLRGVWPKLEKAFGSIRTMAFPILDEPNDPFDLSDACWSMIGMRSSVEAASWIGKSDEAKSWRKDYDGFMASFHKSVELDAREDGSGSSYLPILKRDRGKVSPQRGQFSFLQAVFPGKVFGADDPLSAGTMSMLDAANEEGLIPGSGLCCGREWRRWLLGSRPGSPLRWPWREYCGAFSSK